MWHRKKWFERKNDWNEVLQNFWPSFCEKETSPVRIAGAITFRKHANQNVQKHNPWLYPCQPWISFICWINDLHPFLSQGSLPKELPPSISGQPKFPTVLAHSPNPGRSFQQRSHESIHTDGRGGELPPFAVTLMIWFYDMIYQVNHFT